MCRLVEGHTYVAISGLPTLNESLRILAHMDTQSEK